MNRNPQTGALEPFDFEHLLQNVPELRQFDLQIDTYQFQPPIDSSDMSPRLWTDLSHVIADRYTDYDGFVVLHGTDTMAYTASVLSYMMENLTKPIIFTGSQLPIGLLRTDGKENLITSIEIAAACDDEGHALVPEVGIYFNGHLLRGNRTTKQSADEFNAFESFNYPHLTSGWITTSSSSRSSRAFARTSYDTSSTRPTSRPSSCAHSAAVMLPKVPGCSRHSRRAHATERSS